MMGLITLLVVLTDGGRVDQKRNSFAFGLRIAIGCDRRLAWPIPCRLHEL